MLRVEMQDTADALILKLEGRFTDAEAEHLRALVTRCYTERKMVFDLTEVIFVDSLGEAVLSFFGRLGAKFIAETAYSLDVCERLRLTWLASSSDTTTDHETNWTEVPNADSEGEGRMER